MVSEIPEFDLLLETSQEDLERVAGRNLSIAESVMLVRNGQVHIAGGYDGVFGKIQIYSTEECKKMSLKPKQQSLF